MAMGKSSESNHNDKTDDKELIERTRTVAGKLLHLDIDERARLKELLYDESILIRWYPGLKSAELPVQHSFELKNDSPIKHCSRRLSPKHDQVVQREVNKMLEAEVIVPATSEWSLSILMEINKAKNRILRSAPALESKYKS